MIGRSWCLDYECGLRNGLGTISNLETHYKLRLPNNKMGDQIFYWCGLISRWNYSRCFFHRV